MLYRQIISVGISGCRAGRRWSRRTEGKGHYSTKALFSSPALIESLGSYEAADWRFGTTLQCGVGKIVEGGNVNLECRRIRFRKIS